MSRQSQKEENKETPLSLYAHGHHFVRYFDDDEFAEEMKCSYCGYIIWPCWSEDDVTKCMIAVDGEVKRGKFDIDKYGTGNPFNFYRGEP